MAEKNGVKISGYENLKNLSSNSWVKFKAKAWSTDKHDAKFGCPSAANKASSSNPRQVPHIGYGSLPSSQDFIAILKSFRPALAYPKKQNDFFRDS